MSKIKKSVLIITSVLFVLTVLFVFLTASTGNPVCYALAITFGTFLYHFVMRLLVGSAVGHRFNCHSFWFKEKKFEKTLYKIIKVKKWKGKMPSYNPQTYMTKDVPFDEIANTMCRNEVIHEVIALLSFVPILFSIPFGEPLVFILTSIAACLFDLVFVVMQRYNRPRVLRMIERKSKKNY